MEESVWPDSLFQVYVLRESRVVAGRLDLINFVWFEDFQM
jgi:hypothetical protein